MSLLSDQEAANLVNQHGMHLYPFMKVHRFIVALEAAVVAKCAAQQPLLKAVEFAEYMAKGAEQLLSALINEDEAHVSLNELDRDDSGYEAADEAHCRAIDARTEFTTSLRSEIYEFRKRVEPAVRDVGAVHLDERKAFEFWLIKQGWVGAPSTRENGTYVNGQAQARWLAWQARAEAAIQGRVQVPVDPTDDMLIAGQEAWMKCRATHPAMDDCEEAEAVYRAMVGAAA